MPEIALFPHETLFSTHAGTLFIFPEQLGLATVSLGGRARYAVGCQIAFTQYRIFCEAHLFNRFRGTTTILLDTITGATESPAIPSPHLKVTAGVPYEFSFFAIEQPRTALALALQQSGPERCAEGRVSLLHELFPLGVGNQPPRAAVREVLDKLLITPETVLRALSLYNLWMSLGNA